MKVRMVECSSLLVFLPFPRVAFSLLSNHLPSLCISLWTPLSCFLMDTVNGTRKCLPEWVMFSYFIKCNCIVTVIWVGHRHRYYNFGNLSGCTPHFCGSWGFVLVLGLVQGTSKRCDYKLMRPVLCKQTHQKVYNPNECYPLTWSSWETPHLLQQCCHCSEHVWICP